MSLAALRFTSLVPFSQMQRDGESSLGGLGCSGLKLRQHLCHNNMKRLPGATPLQMPTGSQSLAGIHAGALGRAVWADQNMCQRQLGCLPVVLPAQQPWHASIHLPGRSKGCNHANLLGWGQAWAAADMAGTAQEDWQPAASPEQIPGKRWPRCRAGTAGGTTSGEPTETGASAGPLTWAGGALGAGTAR